MRSVRTALVVAALTLSNGVAFASGTLRIGMTASDIPLTTGQTDQGGEGMRFMGYTVYDALINWDLSSFDKPSDLVPGLAASYGSRSRRSEQEPLDLQDPRRREIPRRFGVHRRVRGVEFRQATQERQPAVRPAPIGAGALARSGDRLLQGGRQIHARDHHQVAGRDAALSARLDHDVVAGAMGEARQELGRLRQGSIRHRTVEADAVRAARARRDGPQQGILGQDARAEARQAGAAAAARAKRARRGAARRPGRLDRGARARRRAVAQEGQVQHRHQRLSAQLDLASVARAGLALERHPRAQGRQPRDRPRGHEGVARRPDDPGRRLHAARPSVVRQADLQGEVRSEPRPRSCWPRRATAQRSRWW